MEQLIHAIKTALTNYKDTKPFVIAIDGLSGAGKTTISKRITNTFANSITFHIDDYIVTRKHRYHTGIDQWKEYYFLQWEIETLKRDFFQNLKDGKNVTLPFYLQKEDTHQMVTTPIQNTDIIIIEGIFLQRDEWKDYYDFIIYMDCPREIRDKRVLNRDKYIGNMDERLEKYKTRYWPAEDYYLSHVSPQQHADFVFINS